MTESEEPFRIVFFDIETAPNIGYTWGKWDQNVISFTREWYMLSFSAKWAHEKKPVTYALPDFPLYKTDRENDKALVKKLWEILNSADLVVAHNGLDFDIRKANARFLFHGLTPPAPYKTVDTLKLARKHFSLNSNKLNDLAQYLGIGSKVETGGFDLWLKCMGGDPQAWKKMKLYNQQDVVLLEKVYERLRPWHTSHPNVSILSDKLACPSCGSPKVQRRGYTYLTAFRAQRYVCTACGRWSKGKNERLHGALLR